VSLPKEYKPANIIETWEKAGRPGCLKWYEQLKGKYPSHDITKDKLEHSLRDALAEIGHKISTYRTFVETQAELPSEESTTEHDLIFKFIRNAPRTLTDIANRIGCSPEKTEQLLGEMEELGYNFRRQYAKVAVTTSIPSRETEIVSTLADEVSQTFKIAVPTDFHFGSTKQQVSALLAFIKTARAEGVKHFLVPGDIFAGINVYRGQENELYANTSEQQEEAAHRILTFPEDEKWYILGGNHDWAWVKNRGIDLVYRFCKRYPNVFYLGYASADVPLTPHIMTRLWHPRGGGSYAKSYRSQKGLETLAPEALKNITKNGNNDIHTWILLLGHLHNTNHTPGTTLQSLVCGSFEGVTLFGKEKAFEPCVGGPIITLHVSNEGLFHRTDVSWLMFDEIEDDWKNYEELTSLGDVIKTDKVEVLFSATEPPSSGETKNGDNTESIPTGPAIRSDD